MSSQVQIEKVYLIGLMGAGKSTVGKLLAKTLDWQFLDLDHEIETVYHKDIPRIFNEQGEEGFRKYETQVLLDTVRLKRAIIACGGGVVTRPVNVDFLSANTTIWLELSPKEAAERLAHTHERPLLEGCQDTLGELNSILLTRQAAYAQAAGIHVDSGGQPPEVIAKSILRAIGQ